MAEIITLHPRADAPIQPAIPRSSFGQRKAFDLSGGIDKALDVALGREGDRAQQERIKTLAREARAALGDTKHVCPSLIVSLAARVGGLAASAEHLAAEAKSYGLLRAAVTLREHAHLLETLSAELEAEVPA